MKILEGTVCNHNVSSALLTFKVNWSPCAICPDRSEMHEDSRGPYENNTTPTKQGMLGRDLRFHAD
jgi:hypothetical protein